MIKTLTTLAALHAVVPVQLNITAPVIQIDA